MPRKKRTIIEENLPDETTKTESEDISDLLIVLTKVYRLNGATKSFCFQSNEPVDEVLIQTRYPNGGKFLVQEYNGMNEMVNHTTVDIEPAPPMTTPLQTPTTGLSAVDIQNRMLLDELQWTRQMLLQLISNNNHGNGSTPVGELVAAMQGIHSIAGKDPIDLLIKGMELGSKSGGAAQDWKSELIHTAKEIVPSALQAISSLTPNHNSQQLQPNGQPMLSTLTPEGQLKFGLQWIRSRIMGGMTPDLAVNWLIQNANDPQYEPILSTAIQGNIDNFIALDPLIANEPYRTWFTTAIQMLKEWYAEQSAVIPDNDGGDGDSTDVADDADSSVGKPAIKKV